MMIFMYLNKSLILLCISIYYIHNNTVSIKDLCSDEWEGGGSAFIIRTCLPLMIRIDNISIGNSENSDIHFLNLNLTALHAGEQNTYEFHSV